MWNIHHLGELNCLNLSSSEILHSCLGVHFLTDSLVPSILRHGRSAQCSAEMISNQHDRCAGYVFPQFTICIVHYVFR